MVTSHVFRMATCLLTAAIIPAACKQGKPEPAKHTIGHQINHLRVGVGSIWGDGYSVDVVPESYAVVEHSNCPLAKEAPPPTGPASGLCALRITKEQSDRFEAGMERFKRYAVPLQNFSLEDSHRRPDGKGCRNEGTDSAWVTLTWTGTEGAKIASFYLGCDYEEFEQFYNSVLSVTDPLPVQQIIAED
jgi:hypothetical protein